MSDAVGTLPSSSVTRMPSGRRSVLSSTRRGRWWLIVRLGIYVIAASLLLEAAVLAATTGHAAGLAVEEGPLEAVQVILASLACTAFFFAAVLHSQFKELFELCALALVAFAVRELDNYLDRQVAPGAYMYCLVPIIALAAIVMYRGRRTLARQIETYAMTPSSTMLLFGLFVLLCYAQVIGQESFWRAMSSGDQTLVMRRAVEEVSEAPGYLFFLFGSIEALIWNGRLETHAH